MNTVLVATERDLEQNLLAQALDGKGYHVIRSRDGLDALEAARSKSPQVLLVNVALPKLDGFALYRRFQQDEQLRCIPVVLFSTRSNDQKSERFAQELGVVRFVANALKPGALNGVIEEALSAELVPLPVVKLKKPVAPRVAEVSPNELHKADVIPLSRATPEPPAAVGAGDDAAPASIDRTLKLQALIASPEAEQIAELQMEQARLKQSLLIAQQQLAGAQTWRELFVASPVAMWITHKPTQKMLAVNPAALRLFGYSQEEFLALESPDMLRDQGQVNVTNVFGFRGKDGKSMSLLVNSADLEFETQSAEVWTAHDVTYRVRGERAMADEVQRVKGQLAALPMPYWVINADKRVREANAACCQLLGYSREYIIEHGLTDLLHDAQEAAALLQLPAGERLTVSMKQSDGSVKSIEFIAGHGEFGAGQRLYALQAEQAPITLEMVAKPPAASKLPVVLEMLRYAEDADEGTLLQYAMAQLAQVFDSPLSMFASLERVTQTLDVCAINHAQGNRRSNGGSPIAVPAPWHELLTRRTVCSSDNPDDALLVEGLPEISSYAACSAGTGRELWLLVIGNRDTAYTLEEQRELQECAEILVALLARKRQQFKLQSVAQRSAAATESVLGVVEKLLDQHDAFAAGSGQRVASLAVAIARQLGLNGEQQTALAYAGRLHDVGHLMLPQSLLLKPTAFSTAERGLMQTHVEQGIKLLRSIDLGVDVSGIVAQHHERLNGSGYPLGTQGPQISIEARILAVADVLEAMSRARAWQPAQSLEAALTELKGDAGRLYDAEVLAACERVFDGNDGRWPV